MKLTVAMPFFNEQALLASLPDLCERILTALEGHEVRLLAVDDGSTDRTPQGLAGFEVIRHEQNRGVGAAIATAISHASGEAVLIYDPDEPYAPETLPALVAALDHADLATLSPYHPDGGVSGVGFLRRILSRGASWLYRRRLNSGLHTFTCAVRAYRLPRARELLPAPQDFTASAYLLATALRRHWRIAEVPAVLNARRSGSSKMRLPATIRAHLRLLHDLAVTAKRSNPGP